MPVGIPAHAQTWEYHNDGSGSHTNTEAKAAVTGKAMWITHIFFNAASTQTLKLMDATGGTVKFGTLTLAAKEVVVVDRSANPIEVGLSKAVFLTTVGGGVQAVSLAGYVV